MIDDIVCYRRQRGLVINLFISPKQRIGCCYYEFQFCKRKRPVRFGKVNTMGIKCWRDDSLLIFDKLFDEFFCKYSHVLKVARFSSGDTGFYPFGINYYDKCFTDTLLQEIKKDNYVEYEELVSWLEDALNKYNGFYILGL